MSKELSDQAMLAELGARLGRHRLQRNLTQAELAQEAGVSKRTVERVEAGEGAQLANLIRLLRALDLSGSLDALVPEALPSPLAQLQLRGRERRRASGVREPAPTGAWTWNERPDEPA